METKNEIFLKLEAEIFGAEDENRIAFRKNVHALVVQAFEKGIEVDFWLFISHLQATKGNVNAMVVARYEMSRSLIVEHFRRKSIRPVLREAHSHALHHEPRNFFGKIWMFYDKEHLQAYPLYEKDGNLSDYAFETNWHFWTMGDNVTLADMKAFVRAGEIFWAGEVSAAQDRNGNFDNEKFDELVEKARQFLVVYEYMKERAVLSVKKRQHRQKENLKILEGRTFDAEAPKSAPEIEKHIEFLQTEIDGICALPAKFCCAGIKKIADELTKREKAQKSAAKAELLKGFGA